MCNAFQTLPKIYGNFVQLQHVCNSRENVLGLLKSHCDCKSMWTRTTKNVCTAQPRVQGGVSVCVCPMQKWSIYLSAFHACWKSNEFPLCCLLCTIHKGYFALLLRRPSRRNLHDVNRCYSDGQYQQKNSPYSWAQLAQVYLIWNLFLYVSVLGFGISKTTLRCIPVNEFFLRCWSTFRFLEGFLYYEADWMTHVWYSLSFFLASFCKWKRCGNTAQRKEEIWLSPFRPFSLQDSMSCKVHVFNEVFSTLLFLIHYYLFLTTQLHLAWLSLSFKELCREIIICEELFQEGTRFQEATVANALASSNPRKDIASFLNDNYHK